MSTEKRTCEGIDSYELDYWLPRLGSFPIKRVVWKDVSRDYEMNVCHVLQLESGQYAVVTECGCSCYSAGDADIDMFPNEEMAMRKFNEWCKENK